MSDRTRYTVVVKADVRRVQETSMRTLRKGNLASFSSAWTTDPNGRGPATHYAFSGAFLPGELGQLKAHMAQAGLIKGVSWWDDESEEPLKFLAGLGIVAVNGGE